MSDLIIYGASDDLIEVDGLLTEELTPPYGKAAVVHVKVDDTFYAHVLIEYDPDGTGEWRIQPTAVYADMTFAPARGEDEGPDDDGCPGYSDKLVIDLGAIEARRVDVSCEAVR